MASEEFRAAPLHTRRKGTRLAGDRIDADGGELAGGAHFVRLDVQKLVFHAQLALRDLG
jgi:hypothetical protein